MLWHYLLLLPNGHQAEATLTALHAVAVAVVAASNFFDAHADAHDAAACVWDLAPVAALAAYGRRNDAEAIDAVAGAQFAAASKTSLAALNQLSLFPILAVASLTERLKPLRHHEKTH